MFMIYSNNKPIMHIYCSYHFFFWRMCYHMYWNVRKWNRNEAQLLSFPPDSQKAWSTAVTSYPMLPLESSRIVVFQPTPELLHFSFLFFCPPGHADRNQSLADSLSALLCFCWSGYCCLCQEWTENYTSQDRYWVGVGPIAKHRPIPDDCVLWPVLDSLSLCHFYWSPQKAGKYVKPQGQYVFALSTTPSHYSGHLEGFEMSHYLLMILTQRGLSRH